jgi:hypothetical protein
MADVFHSLAEQHNWHGRLSVVVLLEFVSEYIFQLIWLVPIYCFERELAVAYDLVHERGEDVFRLVALCVRSSLD